MTLLRALADAGTTILMVEQNVRTALKYANRALVLEMGRLALDRPASELLHELSRRLELQAQCFSGMFLAATHDRGSVDANILTEARTSQDRGDHNAGQPRDHGTDAHTTSWWEQGAQKNRTYQCNTWKSPAVDVA